MGKKKQKQKQKTKKTPHFRESTSEKETFEERPLEEKE